MYDIDVHIIRPLFFDARHIKWLDQCVGSLENEPVNIHLTGKYVSFVDIDDWVEPGIFGQCYQTLQDNPHVCGVYTTSMQVRELDGKITYTQMAPYHPWPLPATGLLTDIHQLTVMNRVDCLTVYQEQYNFIPPKIHEMPWVYWEMAKSKPWLALNQVGYYWRMRPDGAHRIFNAEISQSLKRSLDHMNTIRRQITA